MSPFFLRVLFLSLATVSLSNCMTLSKKQCSEMNWGNRGYGDGKNGKKPTQVNDYQKQCQKHSIAVDRNQYNGGYQAGLKLFCTFENGLAEGEAGNDNEKVCPPDLAVEFNKGHFAGTKVYNVKKQLEGEQNEREEQAKKMREEYEEQAEDAREENDQRILESMNQCSSDSQCGPLKCESDYVSVGSASGWIHKCK